MLLALTGCAEMGDVEPGAEELDVDREHEWIGELDAADVSAEPENYRPAVVAHFDFADGGLVDFIDEGEIVEDGGLAIVWMGSKGGQLRGLAAEQNASPLEIYQLLAGDAADAADAPVPDAIVAAHESMVFEGRASAQPRTLLVPRDGEFSKDSNNCASPGFNNWATQWFWFSLGHGDVNESEINYFTSSTNFSITTGGPSEKQSMSACQVHPSERADYKIQSRPSIFSSWSTLATYNNVTSQDGPVYQSYTVWNQTRITIHSDTGSASYNLGASWDEASI